MVNQHDMEQRFLEAFDSYSDAIFRHCYFRVYSKERAEELMQETFIKAWDYVRRGGEIKDMRPFLYKVANNLVIDESRKKKSYSLDLLQESGFDPVGEGTHEIQAAVEGKDIVQLLEHLEEEQREVLVMRYIDDLQPKEIARLLEVSENVVSVRIHRALKKLRKISEEVNYE
jgi:RNA polymerase sigma-70 factor, ECF subfamily